MGNRLNAKRAGEMTPAAVRDLVWLRCGGRCERCGRPLVGEWEAHHRLLRSQGGLWSPDNVVALHPRCHNQHPDSVHDNPRRSYADGFLVRSHDVPCLVPVQIAPSGQARWLTLVGTYSMEAPAA